MGAPPCTLVLSGGSTLALAGGVVVAAEEGTRSEGDIDMARIRKEAEKRRRRVVNRCIIFGV